MSSDEQAPAPGSVPNAYGNALSWKWTRAMSTYLRRSGLPLLLCQLRNYASASGEVAFSSDRKPIRISDIAAASCCSVKDCRRYLEAAIRAGVVRVLGERKKGAPVRYVIVVHPFPDWQAAEDYLKSTARKPGKRAPEWSDDDGSKGHRDPNQKGSPRPLVTDGTDSGEGVTATPPTKGHRDPTGWGHRDPNNPGVTHVSTHDGAEVGFQPQVVGAPEDQIDHQEHHHDDTAPAPDPDDYETWTRCHVCRRPILPDPQRPGRTVHARCEPHLATTNPERHTA
ncbi:hypothetical protein DIZ27_23205 [Streptomyces sp. NWU339]|uniref:hypothetical protein n=1 Tax=Streptomyces sp. NWU339 TaxID=2185284 RepID=UPI000D67491B|nr:hypothetical protein [Streptomyces sp. NWU339]PWI08349.1 hypothetical protein DIZ27_23205 [Streptomyces sp. NWU339]